AHEILLAGAERGMAEMTLERRKEIDHSSDAAAGGRAPLAADADEAPHDDAIVGGLRQCRSGSPESLKCEPSTNDAGVQCICVQSCGFRNRAAGGRADAMWMEPPDERAPAALLAGSTQMHRHHHERQHRTIVSRSQC